MRRLVARLAGYLACWFGWHDIEDLHERPADMPEPGMPDLICRCRRCGKCWGFL